jgi:hypothetical protein
MPKFFFTLSFLKSFFQKYQDKLFDGIPLENQESFVRFFRNGHGHILVDESMHDLENYPVLNSIMVDPAQANYRPFFSDSHKFLPEFVPEKLVNEVQCLTTHAAIFTDSFDQSLQDKLTKKYLKPIFNNQFVENKFCTLLTTTNIKKGGVCSWRKILTPIIIPTGSIIISDNYILQNKIKINYNILPILHSFASLKLKKIPVIILTANRHGVDFKNIKRNAEQQLNREFANVFKVEVVIINGGINSEHDRRIVTDTASISIPHGLDLVNNTKNISRGTTEPSLVTIFDGNEQSTDHLLFLQNSLQKSIETGKLQAERL